MIYFYIIHILLFINFFGINDARRFNTGIEIFVPELNTSTNIIESKCPGNTMSIEWTYDGKISKLSKFNLGDVYASEQDIELVNQSLLDLKGNVHVNAYCHQKSAAVYFYRVNLQTGSQSNKLFFNFVNGRFIRI